MFLVTYSDLCVTLSPSPKYLGNLDWSIKVSITNISIFISHLKSVLDICQFETNAAELKSELSEEQCRLFCVVERAVFGTSSCSFYE